MTDDRSKELGTGDGSGPRTPKTPTSASASAPVETDDFGLPIRQFASPKPNEAADSSDDVPGTSPTVSRIPETTPTHSDRTTDVAELQKDGPSTTLRSSKESDDKTEKSSNDVDPKTPTTAAPAPTPSSADDERKTPASNDDDAKPIDSQTKLANQQSVENGPLPATEAGVNRPPQAGHNRDTSIVSTVSNNEGGVSEFSHQQISTQPKQEEEEGDGGWQTMPAFARYDMYDDDDRLIAREHDADADEKLAYAGLGGAGKGYTRVQMDEDAQSATSMDDNTQYLFKEAARGTAVADEDDDEDARDAMGQMQATKDLLTEGQRIAYAGIVRLEISNLVKAAEDVEMTKKTKKEVSAAAEGTKMWGQKMMIRLYTHMDINSDEQVMIEQLAEHGVVPADLTPALHVNARVHNPMADRGEGIAAVEELDDDADDVDDEEKGQKADENEDLQAGQTATKTTVDEDAEGSDGRKGSHNSKALSSPSSSDDEFFDPPPPYESGSGDAVPEVQTPTQLPTSKKIDIDLRWTVLCDLFLILIADAVYDSRSRILLERVGADLDVSWIDICRFEKRVTDALEMQQAAEKENWNEDDHLESRRKRALKKRYLMIGLATVGGGLVIGLSAGIMAPMIATGIAAGVTTIFGAGAGGGATFLAGAGGAAIITSASASAGGIIGGKAAHKRTGAVKTFEYRPLHNNKRVNLIVTVSGWLAGKVDDIRLPFSTVDPIMGDIYSVLWEPEMLTSMGDTIRILATEALTQSIQQVLGSTILTVLMGALQAPVLLSKLAYLIDNPWTVSLDRATDAGKILADSLIDRNLGTRPITLVGYSLGSRLIFSCLQELAKRGAVGLVQNVYLFGSPLVVRKDEFIRARTVVSGRFVNAYSRTDWILGYLFRLTAGGISRVAGLAAVEDFSWVENYDVSDLVAGHMEYRQAMPKLLKRCGWQMESEEFTEIEDPDPDNHEARHRELINEIEEARKELEEKEKNGKASKGGVFGIFGRRKKGQKADWEVYEDSNKEGPKEVKLAGDAETYQATLFDVDAIRAELAKEGTVADGEALQVKELKSTLPPMKLDVPSASPNMTSPGTSSIWGSDTVRENRSFETYSATRASSESRLAPVPPIAWGAPSNGRGSSGAGAGDDEGIQMTFDTSFDDDRSRPPPPPKDTNLSRPPITSSQTLPNMTMSDPWSDPDHEDFGKEKEISMTFA